MEPSSQDEHEFSVTVASNVDCLTLQTEATLLQHADRSDVVLHHVRVKWSFCHYLQEGAERSCRDALPPMLFANPITHQAKTFLGPAPHIARDLAIDEDRSSNRIRIAENILVPMRVE